MKLFCLYFFVLYPLCLFGQITGRVTDSSGEPLQAIIYIEGSNKSVQADGYGLYAFRIKKGEYTLTAFVLGYEPSSKLVGYNGGQITLDFTLTELKGELEAVTISGTRANDLGLNWLQSVQGTSIYEAKKTELIAIDQLVGNLATNTTRQVYARVPGLNTFENDGAGLQLAIGARGLDPNRTSNFNVRQNGYDISADALGYPESYYTPPVQALEQIEIVRGAAGLQYGSQFGGLLNFRFKEGRKDNIVQLDLSQTIGSYGLFNSFNSMGGTVGKTNYYGFYQYKRSDGWRPNSSLAQHTVYGSIRHEFSPFFSVKADLTHMNYTAQQPGGLTDQDFAGDPTQSKRARNWFQVGWNIAALEWNYRINSSVKLNNRSFLLKANRYAVGNLERIDRPDDITKNRNLIKDDYDNWGNEFRAIFHYNFLGNRSVLLVGNRYYQGLTNSAQGDGTNGSDPDFEFNNPEMPEDSKYQFPSKNMSLFAENIFNISPNFSLTPGIRYEYILTEADGYYVNKVVDFAGNVILFEVMEEQRRDAREIALLGLGLSYKISELSEAYANFSQNYRGINFTDIRIDIPSLIVDPDISDESGFNADGGLRGSIDDHLTYDLSGFFLAYKDRIGNILTEINDQPRTLRTNIGDATILGFESYVEWSLSESLEIDHHLGSIRAFLNLAAIHSEYTSALEKAGSLGEVIVGNKVELVPPLTIKAGIKYNKQCFKGTLLYSYVARHFTDAANTAPAAATAVQGPIPAYGILDLSLSYELNRFTFDAGINNLLNNYYFTRRASGYPGPGIIPAEPRSFYFTARFAIAPFG